ncbi:MAG: hypothetical protein HYW38_00585, partial [Candidatus Colwellbacteria bacterium]|nr:hypothetical protein [Candidatus Colwellbacteria bacterium]
MTLVSGRLRVDVIAGAELEIALWAAQELARRWLMVVEFEYDGVVVRVDAESDLGQLEADWQKALETRPIVVGAQLDSTSPLLSYTEQDREADLVGRMLLASIEFTDPIVDRLWAIYSDRTGEPISHEKA